MDGDSDAYVRSTYYANVRTGLRGGRAGGGPRPADVGGLGVCDGVGVADADAEAEAVDGDDDEGSVDSLRSAESDDSWPKSSAATALRLASEFWPGDEATLAPGGVPVSEARFSLSFEAIDCRAAEARDVDEET